MAPVDLADEGRSVQGPMAMDTAEERPCNACSPL